MKDKGKKGHLAITPPGGMDGDIERMMEKNGMRYGGQDQMCYATGRPKKPTPKFEFPQGYDSGSVGEQNGKRELQ